MVQKVQHTFVAVAPEMPASYDPGISAIMGKPFTTVENQIAILKSRGIQFDDEEYAKKMLYKIGYYNLINAYKNLFLARSAPETFVSDTKFEYFVVAHDLDFAYRQIILARIIGIENSLKSIIAYEFAQKYGATGYNDIANFKSRGQNDVVRLQTTIQKMIRKALNSGLRNSPSYDCVLHHKQNHGEIPIWVLFRILYLGQFALFYECLTDDLKNTICANISDKFEVMITRRDLYNYLKILEVMRNVCAHGQRVYNFTTRYTVSTQNQHLRTLLAKLPRLDIHSCNVIILIFYQLLDKSEFRTFADDITSAWLSAHRRLPRSVFANLMDNILGEEVFIKHIEYLMKTS